jgi:hypothetical protein
MNAVAWNSESGEPITKCESRFKKGIEIKCLLLVQEVKRNRSPKRKNNSF